MKRFLLMIVTLILAVGCQQADKIEKEVNQGGDNSGNNEVVAELEIDKSEFVLDYRAQSVEVVVTSNLQFEVGTNADWITTTILQSGDRVVVAVLENRTSEPRSAEVTLTAGELSRMVTITQLPEPEKMRLELEHTSTLLDSPTWDGNNIRGSIDWGDGAVEEYQEGVSHEYVDDQKRSAQFTMEGATSFCIESIGEIESVILAL